nr:Protein T13F3.8 [Haemonchus contortus]
MIGKSLRVWFIYILLPVKEVETRYQMLLGYSSSNIYLVVNVIATLLTIIWNSTACGSSGKGDQLAVEDFLKSPEKSFKGSISNESNRKKTSSSSKSKSGKQGPKSSYKGPGPRRKSSGRPRMPRAKRPTLSSADALDLFPKVARATPDQGTPMNKLQRIALGAKKDKDAYPTFDDIQSDWDDEKERIKPKQVELGDKEKKIAMGAKKDTSAYPTMDDIMSDWDTNEDGEKQKKKKDTESRAKSWVGPKKKR